jgi:hypothetical protein
MVKPRQRRKVKQPNSKVSRRVTKNKKRVVVTNPLVRAAWDKRQTLQRNYERLGLAATANPEVMESVDMEPSGLNPEDVFDEIEADLKGGEGSKKPAVHPLLDPSKTIDLVQLDKQLKRERVKKAKMPPMRDAPQAPEVMEGEL